MFDPKHLVDPSDFDMNIGSIAETCRRNKHPFDCGNYEAEELH